MIRSTLGAAPRRSVLRNLSITQYQRGLSTADSSSSPQSRTVEPESKDNTRKTEEIPVKKSMSQLDDELRLKMEGIAGDGGASGVEYEDGKAEGLKRGVKSNMFRVI